MQAAAESGLDSFMEIGNCSIMASLFKPEQAALTVHIDVRKTESDCPIQIDHLIKLPTDIVSLCVIRI